MRFVNVPSFVVALDVALAVDGLPPLVVDIAYGGAFFAIVDARAFGMSLKPGDARRCVEIGEKIKAAAAAISVTHPVLVQVCFCSHYRRVQAASRLSSLCCQ